MKTLRIFLLILIILGIAALCTQKLWVPKLVARIIGPEYTPLPVQQPIVLKDGEQCYTYSHTATDTEPYATSEFIDLTIKGTAVSGTKKGTQQGPDMSNGYTGTIAGTLHDNSITDIFSYVIEGSHNKEQEIYRAGLTGIEKLRYPLVDTKGVLVPDTTKPFSILKYARVSCTGSN